MPESVNEILQNRIVRHLLYLTRLSSHEANWVKDQIKQGLFPELVDDIAAGIVRMKGKGGEVNLINEAQTKELDKLIAKLDTKSTKFIDQLKKDLFKRLNDIAKNEVDFEEKLLKKTLPIKWDFKDVADAKIKELLEKQPVDGKPLGEWFSDLGPKNIDRVSQTIRQGMLAGDSIDDIVRRIRGTRAKGFTDGVLNTTTQHAEALARSGVIHASNQATNQFYRNNDDIIKGIAVVVTLDSSTCPICISYEEGNPYPLENHPTPGFHIRCRCTTVAITKSFKELGINIEEAPEGTRASMNGEVPESMRYSDWLAKQDDDIVEEALGPGKANLYKEGKIEVKDFTDREHRILSLKEIRAKEADIQGVEDTATVIRSANLEEHKKQVKQYFDEATRAEINAIANYTGTHYTYINKAYRTDSEISDFFKGTDELLKPLLESAPKYEGTVYRGINTNEKSLFNFFKRHDVGDSYVDKAYLSSSLKEAVAKDFSGYESYKYKIVLNIEGKNGVYIADISQSKFEEEVIFKPRSKFIVKGKNVNGNTLTLDLKQE